MTDPDKPSVNKLNKDLFRPEEVDRFTDPTEARKKAMDYLARREYGQNELVNKLIAAGFEATVAHPAVVRLSNEGLQDDRRFVESFIRSRINQGKGPQKIHADLNKRGLPSGVIDRGLRDVDVNWTALARHEREKKFGPDTPQTYKERARQMRFLQSRGFGTDHIQAAVSGSDPD